MERCKLLSHSNSRGKSLVTAYAVPSEPFLGKLLALVMTTISLFYVPFMMGIRKQFGGVGGEMLRGLIW